jgi:iron complex transport system substrate-binding protein
VCAVRSGDIVSIDIRNPWDTATLLRSIQVKVPVKRAAVYSATHAALLEELGVAGYIGGIFDTKYLKNSRLREDLANGDIRDLGTSNAVNIEQVMDLQPDLLMPSPYESQGGYGRLEQMGIPIMECADYMEVSPLARAEWIRVYGMLFGVEQRADSLFMEIEQRYNELKGLASTCKELPRLLTERPLSGTWHVPNGESTTGILYRDAGADYLFADIPGNGASAMSIEMVLDRVMDADLWLVKSFGSLTKEQIIDDTPVCKHIPARLLVCNTEEVPFFEETPFHPEYLLGNLISVLHPELGLKAEHEYFR